MKTKPDIQLVAERQNYFLVAGEIIFQLDEKDPPTAIRLNAVVMNKDSQFAVIQIARAQQTLQMQLHKQMEEPTLQVLNVVILGIMPLGLFTAEEFNAKPPGMGVEVRETSDVLSTLPH